MSVETSGKRYLSVDFPEVCKEWCQVHNPDLDLDRVTAFSKRVVCFVCKLGHHTKVPVQRKTLAKSGCGVCTNKVLLKGFNDMGTVRPELTREWDFEANGEVTPQDVFPGSPFLAHWICPDGHKYVAKVNNRAAGQLSGCGVCSNRVLRPGVNDLRTIAPHLMNEWDWDANKLDPGQLGKSSTQKAYWRCSKGHQWRASIHHRANRWQGCPYCANAKLLSGFNDLATVRPDLAAQWDRSKNDLPPEHYLAGSSSRVWWRCEQGHSWLTTIDKRASGRGCERCQKRATSIVEQEFYAAFMASPLITDPHDGTFSLPIPWRTRTYMRVDMGGKHSIVGDIAIEYDGSYYHGSPTQIARDVDKTKALLDAGYFVIRIRENDLPHLPIESPRLLQVNHLYGKGDPGSTMHSTLQQLRDCPRV